MDYCYGIELFLPVHRRLLWRVLTRMHTSGVREIGEGDGVCGCLNPDPPKEIKSLLRFVDFFFQCIPSLFHTDIYTVYMQVSVICIHYIYFIRSLLPTK